MYLFLYRLPPSDSQLKTFNWEAFVIVWGHLGFSVMKKVPDSQLLTFGARS